MKLTLDTISAPATGESAAQIVRAVRKGRGLVNARGKVFIASLLAELRPRAGKSSRSKTR